MSPRILLTDIECSPSKVHAWGLRDQNIGLSQILEDPRIMGFGAKWLGDSRVKWFSEYHHSREDMLGQAWNLLDEADVVVHYNGTSFDMPWFTGEFVREDMPLVSPYKNIDLYRVVRKNFRFLSYKLDYVSRALGLEGKVSTGGHELWVRCLERDGEVQRKAWAKMRTYCKQDVQLLEPMFNKLQPYFPGTINMAIYAPGDGPACQKCGSENLESRGIAYTAMAAFPQYRCNDCGGWTRDSKSSWRINTAGVTR